jgi:hypothetical protein
MHEEIIEHIMHLYSEGLEELMGAQKYVKCAHKASSEKDKAMYAEMAREELKHASLLSKSGDNALMNVDHNHSIHYVWKHLKNHLTEWSDDITHQIDKMRS